MLAPISLLKHCKDDHAPYNLIITQAKYRKQSRIFIQKIIKYLHLIIVLNTYYNVITIVLKPY